MIHTPRLTTDVWVSAYLTRLRLADIPVYVICKGDRTAGTVLVKCATLDGRATCHGRSFDPAMGGRIWVILAEGDEAEVDRAITDQRRMDPDVWVVEVEDRQGRHLLNDPSLQ